MMGTKRDVNRIIVQVVAGVGLFGSRVILRHLTEMYSLSFRSTIWCSFVKESSGGGA